MNPGVPPCQTRKGPGGPERAIMNHVGAALKEGRSHHSEYLQGKRLQQEPFEAPDPVT